MLDILTKFGFLSPQHQISRKSVGRNCSDIRGMDRHTDGQTDVHAEAKWRFFSAMRKLSLYKELNIVEDIKIRTLEWAGHIIN
jgi:hypothetical protein